ncbi:MAG TPA: DUF2935 domain-containing protein, partial [Bacillota bacterium]|nr:DUF2935 domain-containing protein [Bacillota bacterium]
YEDKMLIRVLDEGEFWKHQEGEHTEVIRALVKDLEPQFIKALQEWEQAFARTEEVFIRYVELFIRSGSKINPLITKQIMELVQFALDQSIEFVKLLDQLGTTSKAVKSSPTAVTVLNHIRRESEYFIGIAKALVSNS